MNILMVCAEFAPLAKTGGLADSVTGLSQALVARGHDVRVVLPRYAHLPVGGAAVTARDTAGREHRFSVARSTGLAPKVYLLDLEGLTGDAVYTGDARDAGRFLHLCSGATALPSALGWRPDVIHCHDWHAALVPVLLEGSPRPASILTLHNVGYQGIFPATALTEYGPPGLAARLGSDALAAGQVNFLRAGLAAADRVTTVSPTYAAEILSPAFGMGLEDILLARAADLVGILNGVDYGVWGPANDPFIGVRYTADDLAPKYRLKGRLSARLGLLPDQNAPLVGTVSRLATQKGLDLVVAVLPELLRETRANFAFLASGDAAMAAALARLAAEHPRRVAFKDGYDEPLAHWLLAGSDLTLVPSRYEPCGLTQMYALAYGTIPVVRATGGLADTVQHFDPITGTGTGSVFRDADGQGLLWGIRSAFAWFDDPTAWSQLIANAMAADFSWEKRVGDYERLYSALAA
jgi:starch synthase